MACPIPEPKPPRLLWMIDKIRGADDKKSVSITCEEFIDNENFSVKLRHGRDDWSGTCDSESCFAEEKIYSSGSWCDPQPAVTARNFRQNFLPDESDAGAGGAGGMGGDLGTSGTDGSLGDMLVTDANETPDSAVADASDAAVPTPDAVVAQDAAADSSQIQADMSLPTPDAAPEPDAAELPNLLLQGLPFGITRENDPCLQHFPSETSSCLGIDNAAHTLDGAQLFSAVNAPLMFEFTRNAGTIPDAINALQNNFQLMNPSVDQAQTEANWDITRVNEAALIGALSATSTIECNENGCNPQYTIYLRIIQETGAEPVTCEWRYPAPAGLDCQGVQ